MKILKRDGSLEDCNLDKIVKSVSYACTNLSGVDPSRIAVQTVAGIFDGVSSHELDLLSIKTAAGLIFEEPNYSYVAARLLLRVIEKDCAGVNSFEVLHNEGILSEKTYFFYDSHRADIDRNIADTAPNSLDFEYFGLQTLVDRYLLKVKGKTVETPQALFMRVALGLNDDIEKALKLFWLISDGYYLPSTPTLFNGGTKHPQMSSCYLLDSPGDDLAAIYNHYGEIAQLSKWAGGIGTAYSKVRAAGAGIKGTGGKSNGIIPFLKTLDASVAAVNQGGKRKGACCVYLESWHADIEAFLELRDNTGDQSRRVHNINIANWIPDLFMQQVESDGYWYLFCPSEAPGLADVWGAEFNALYVKYVSEKKFRKEIKARELYARMMKTLAETGNGWMCFKDASNRSKRQQGIIHSSNLCTEILEVTDEREIAVCNLGSINLARHCSPVGIDWEELGHTVDTAVKNLDRVIDINFYPVDKAEFSNQKHRPIGLGIMGWQDVLFMLNIAFDSSEALHLAAQLQNFIKVCAEAATPFKNSLYIAIAPTATIASIAGCYECIEPQVSNLFKRETLSGDFLQVNRYLVRDLQAQGMWTQEVRDALVAAKGSVQGFDFLPESKRKLYQTAWEIPQRALIDLAAARQPHIDQSQSLNLFVENTSIGKLSSMYMYAWKQGLKTTYYLRSRPASEIRHTGYKTSAKVSNSLQNVTDAIACSLENPESCESCT